MGEIWRKSNKGALGGKKGKGPERGRKEGFVNCGERQKTEAGEQKEMSWKDWRKKKIGVPPPRGCTGIVGEGYRELTSAQDGRRIAKYSQNLRRANPGDECNSN